MLPHSALWHGRIPGSGAQITTVFSGSRASLLTGIIGGRGWREQSRQVSGKLPDLFQLFWRRFDLDGLPHKPVPTVSVDPNAEVAFEKVGRRGKQTQATSLFRFQEGGD